MARLNAEKETAADAAKKLQRVGYEDMTQMDDMTLESVLGNCQLRYKNDLIYTYTGSILVAINPFKRLPIYTPDIIRRYVGMRIGLLPPHVFAVAENAYKHMFEFGRNQSILISGESGAGKTETTKLILNFLSGRSESGKISNIESKILESVPILEALGNARTLRNDNSSRFGKYIEIQFDKNFAICGSKIIPYLLEKSRLVSQLKGERNYHIFYMLTEGSSDEDRERYHFRPANWYNYLNVSGCYKLDDPSYNETEQLADLRRALSVFELSPKIMDHIWKILSAVLHCGNVMWEGDVRATLANDEANSALEIVGEMLGLEKQYLRYALSHRRITVNNEDIWKDLDGAAARDLTDTFAKSLYAHLFDWLVEKLNECTLSDQGKSFIGVLDIFGFENFGKNALEQFLINQCNEKLQCYFNHFIFSLEQEEYRRENIDFSKIEFKDNQPVLDTIEGSRPPGILAILAEQCKFARATDKTLIDALNDNFGDGKNPFYERLKLQRTHFALTHYAGRVVYDTSGWLEKNRDELAPHLIELCVEQAQNPFVSLLYTDAADDGGANRQKTLGTQFKSQLGDLMNALNATQPSFIRCIKPNMAKKPDNFDEVEIEAQLRYAGMLETIRIRRMGYPVRYVHKDFLYRYQVLDPSYTRIAGNDSRSCHNLIEKLGINPDRVKVGLTKVFLKQDLANELDDGRNGALLKHVIKLQAWWRMQSARIHYNDMKTASVTIQAAVRRWIARKNYLNLRSSTIQIQCAWRCWLARKERRLRAEERQRILAALSAKERAAREKAERALAEQEAAAIEALKRGEVPERIRRAQEQKEAAKKKKRRRRGNKSLGKAKSMKLGKNKTVEIPSVVLKKKISVAVGWETSGKKVLLATTCLFFRYGELRDAVHDLNDLSRDGSVEHLGYPYWQRRGGQLATDKEHLSVNLSKVSPKTTTLFFVVTLFTRGLDFDEVSGSYVRILDRETEKELGKFDISPPRGCGATAMVMVKISRNGLTNWNLTCIGEPRDARNYKLIIPTMTPFCDIAPPPRAFEITIHAAKGLAHKKSIPDVYGAGFYDADKHKTHLVKKSLEPAWPQPSTGLIQGRGPGIELHVCSWSRWGNDQTLGMTTVVVGFDRVSLSQAWLPLQPEGQIQVTINEVVPTGLALSPMSNPALPSGLSGSESPRAASPRSPRAASSSSN